MMLFINLFKLLLFHSVSPFSLLAPNRCSVKKVPAPLGDGRFFRFLRNSWDDIFRLYIYIYTHHIIIAFVATITTSSTPQGGGGSFKDRKPMGEVGCCDAWMAE